MTEHIAIAGQPMRHPSYVEADLNYLAPMTERPRNYTFDPPPGVPRPNVVHEKHRMRISSVEVSSRTFRSTAKVSRCCGAQAQSQTSITKTRFITSS